MTTSISDSTRSSRVNETPIDIPQDSALLNMPLEIISRIGIQLTPLEIMNLSLTCRGTLSYPSYIKEQCKEECRDEVRPIFAYSKKHFSTSVDSFDQDILDAIDGLTLQNTQKTINKIYGFLMDFSLKLSPMDKEQLKGALKTEISLNRFEGAFVFLHIQLQQLESTLVKIRQQMSLTC